MTGSKISQLDNDDFTSHNYLCIAITPNWTTWTIIKQIRTFNSNSIDTSSNIKDEFLLKGNPKL